MKYHLNRYPLLLTTAVFLLLGAFLGAPLLGLALILIGGYLLYRGDTAPQPIANRLSGWLIRNRYVLTLAVVLAIVSGLVSISVSSFPPSKLYGFPIAFVTYYLPPDGASALIPPLSSLAVRVPEFLANTAFYFVVLWAISKAWRRRARTG